MAIFTISGNLSDVVIEDLKFDASGEVYSTQAPFVGQFLAGEITGKFGTLSVQASGAWRYSLLNDSPLVQAIPFGQTSIDTFSVLWYGSEVPIIGFLDIKVEGANDPATFSGERTGALNPADSDTISGKLVVMDPDDKESQIRDQAMTRGSIGTFSISKEGIWKYVLLPGQQAMFSAEPKTTLESFLVESIDGSFTQVEVYIANGETISPSMRSVDPPTASTGISVDRNMLLAFSESVRRGVGVITLKSESGNIEFDVASSAQLVFRGNTLLIDPLADLAPNTRYVLDISRGAVLDFAGNEFPGTSDFYYFQTIGPSDTTPPSIIVQSDLSSLGAGQVAVISFTLSEASNDFDESDIDVSGGTLTAFRGEGSIYSATFVPQNNSSAIAVLAVASNKFSDAAGNFNRDGAEANNTIRVTVDTIETTIQFASTTRSASEGNSGATIITIDAVLSAVSTQTVAVPITYTGTASSGTATQGTDFTNATTTLTIAAGQTTGSATFAVVGDTVGESNETVILTMGTPVNAALGTNTTFTHIIVDDDTAPPTAQPTGAFLPAGTHIALASSLVNAYGAGGQETVMLGAGAAQVVLDQNVDRVHLGDAPSAYLFQQTGNRLNVFAANGGERILTATLQIDADGTVVVFPGGSASATVGAGGMRLGGAIVPSTAPTAVVPSLGAPVAPPTGASTAGVFCASGANFTAASSGLKVYGAAGTEVVTIARGTSGIEANQLIERLQFNGFSTAALSFQQQGNRLNVFEGSTLLARTPLQTDADGTLITTTAGTMQAKVSSAGMFLGGTRVSSTTPSVVVPREVDTTLKAPADRINVAITVAGTYNAAAGDVTFSLAAVNDSYAYSIAGFGAGDRIVGPTGVRPSVNNDSFEDGRIELLFADAGKIITLAMSGLSADADARLFAASDLDSVFGAGTFSSGSGSTTPPPTTGFITGAGTATETQATSTTFTLSSVNGTYLYTISGFGRGDKIAGPVGVVPSVDNASFDDGRVDLLYASSGNVVTIALTGISASDDALLFSISDLNKVFGAGTSG